MYNCFMNLQQAITRLSYLLEVVPPLLYAIDKDKFCYKPLSDKWSKKEILGHLIDSATNNHQRFVRCQFESTPLIIYDQNNWNAHNYYQLIDSKQLINFWQSYNSQLLLLLTHIPTSHLSNLCMVNNNNSVTLEFIIIDYVEHLEYHLKQLVTY